MRWPASPVTSSLTVGWLASLARSLATIPSFADMAALGCKSLKKLRLREDSAGVQVTFISCRPMRLSYFPLTKPLWLLSQNMDCKGNVGSSTSLISSPKNPLEFLDNQQRVSLTPELTPAELLAVVQTTLGGLFRFGRGIHQQLTQTGPSSCPCAPRFAHQPSSKIWQREEQGISLVVASCSRGT